MSSAFAKAGSQNSLYGVLWRVGPAGLGTYLEDGPGFRMRFVGQEIQQARRDGTRYRFEGTGLVANVVIEHNAELGVAVQQVTLTNAGREPTPPIRDLNAFYLPLNLDVRDQPYAHSVGGGLTDGFYPPRAYREERVCFGKAREWTPPDPTFTRWWVAQQWYALTSEEGGRSAVPHLPLMLVGWRLPCGGSLRPMEVGLWAAMEWSGRWQIRFGATRRRSWQFVFHGGPRVREMVLDPGESVRLPRTYVGAWGGPGADHQHGLNAVRRTIAQILAPDVEGRRPWPFLAYHHWFGIEETLNEELLRKQVDRAAELGLEYFEVDAGWYGGASENFAAGVGNWERVDEAKFPGGLEPFAEYVRSKGLRFGLWFEPERGRRGSDWVTEHPDWYWDIGHPTDVQLDLTRREVQDGLIAMLSRWIEHLDIRWLRWDYNQSPSPFWDAVDPTGKVQFAYVEGLYRVRDVLLERFPNLLIDNCAGGGTRTDFGTLRRAGTMVISDHAEDPHVCRLMQTGGARVLPANYMNSSFYVGPNDPDDAIGPLELMSRMAGCLSLSGHIANWSEGQTALVRRYLDGFRAFRHLLMMDFYALTPYPCTEADWDVVQFADPSTTEAVVLAYRVRGDETERVVQPKRLAARITYEVTDPFQDSIPVRRQGADLREKGLHIALGPESACILHLRPVSLL
jgi:alpha-galactosidase